MNILQCCVGSCKTRFTTNESVASSYRFICKHHTRQEQVSIVRKYDEKEDCVDIEVRFQDRSESMMGTAVDPIQFMSGSVSTRTVINNRETEQGIIEQREHLRVAALEDRLRAGGNMLSSGRSKKASIKRAEMALDGYSEDEKKQILAVVSFDDRDHQ